MNFRFDVRVHGFSGSGKGGVAIVGAGGFDRGRNFEQILRPTYGRQAHPPRQAGAPLRVGSE